MRLALALALLASPALAQDPGLATVTQPPPLAKNVDTYPRIVGNTPAIARINAKLAEADQRLADQVAECLRVENGAVENAVTVTLNGSGFLSILVQNWEYCGAAHGWGTTDPMIFDLNTGTEIEPMQLLPKNLIPPPDPDPAHSDPDLTIMNLWQLRGLYLDHLDTVTYDECIEAVKDRNYSFLLWPDAGRHALIIVPDGMAYIDTPCMNEVAIPVGTLLELHFNPRLIAALAAD